MRLSLRPAAVLLFTALASLDAFPTQGGGSPASATPATSAGTAGTAAPALQVDRLARLARVWGSVRYFHPYLAYREIDWDQALLAAIPRVRQAATPEAYAAAVQSMLDKLGDPVTAVRPRRPPAEPAPPSPASQTSPASPSAAAAPLFRWEEGEVLVLDLRGVADLLNLYEQSAALAQEIAKARAVVVDVRDLPQEDTIVDLGYAFEPLSRSLVHRTVRAPAERYLLHSGYAPQQRATSGGYYSAFVTRHARSYSPEKGDTPARRVVFLTSRGSQLPPVALALQAAGDATVVAEGEIGDETVAARRTFDLGEGFEAVVRLGEIQPMPGWPGVHADVVVPVQPGSPPGSRAPADAALGAALAEARKAPAEPRPPAAMAPAAQPLPDAVWRPDPAYADMADPSPEHRLLAVVRIWNVIHYFYPYRHLIGDWDAVLPQFIARMEEARTARDYALTVAEMTTHVPDGHTGVIGSQELRRLQGEAGLPVNLRWVEGSYVVTEAWGAAREAGIAAGDVLTAVDGEPVEARVESWRRYLTASTEAALRNRIAYFLLRGAVDSPVVLSLRGPGDRLREVKAVRTSPSPRPAPADETVRILPGGFGYADLRRLERSEVDALFEEVKDTRALIFDLRGYPRGTAWAIAPRLNVRGALYGAAFRRPQVDGFAWDQAEMYFGFSQPLPVSDKPKYTRPTVMLIDDRTISQAEHTGLFFEAAAGTVFIGTPTAGANGDVTNLSIPGGIQIGFTGHDVRHADGRQLQRVGLQPHVEVAPTIAGIRAGRDEVLERAVRYLEENAPATPPAP